MPTLTPGLLLVVSGPSGAGKTTIARAVEKKLGGRFSVSATTRARTEADAEGVDYFFLTEDEFQRRVEASQFLECAQVFGSNWYGTPREPVERALADGELMILEIDVQGGLQIRAAMPDAYMVFIRPPSDDELLRRLRKRGREDEAAIQRRFAEYQRELKILRESGAYDAIVVNDDLEKAISEVIALVEQRRSDS